MIFKNSSKTIFKASKIACIPAARDRKGPVISGWTDYTKREPSLEELRKWRKDFPEHNICLPLGHTTNLIAIDIDINEERNPELFQKVHEIFNYTTLQKKGKKGQTLFFRFSGEDKKQFKDGSGNLAVELLSTGNTTDIPPSIHVDTKKPYLWVGKSDLETPNIVNKLPYLKPASITELVKVLNEDKTKSQQSETFGREEKLKKICIAELNKGTTVNKVVSKLLKYDKDNHSPTYFTDKSEFGNESETKNAVFFVKNISKTISNNEETSSLEVLSLQELLSKKMTEPEWICEKLLPSKGFSLLAGPPKVGKSQLARYLTKCVADQENFLGHKVKHGQVLYLALDEHIQNLNSFFQRLNIQNTSKVKVMARSGTKNIFADVCKYIKRDSPSLVIVDTMQRFLNISNVNDYSRVVEKFDQLKAELDKVECHIMFIHHTSKGEDRGADSVLGSTGIFSAVDSLIRLHYSQGTNDIHLTTDLRLSPKLYSGAILKRRKSDLSFMLFKDRDTYRRKRAEMKILKYLRANTATQEQIMKEVRGKTTILKSALNQLLSNQKVTRQGKGNKGNPYKYTSKN